MPKDLLEEAVSDVKKLKEATMEYARQSLLETVAPKMKEYIESQLGETDVALEVGASPEDDELPEAQDLTYETRGKKKDDEDDEEVEEGLELGEVKGDDDEDEEMPPEEPEVEEMVAIEMKDIEEAFARAVKEGLEEAKVTKGFGKVQDPNDHEGSGERGLSDKEKDKTWNEVTPPAAKDWTVKESLYKKKIVEITNRLGQYKSAYEEVSKSLKEVNLFNAKLLYTTKLLQNSGMSNKQKNAVVEHMDKARNRREVELVYQSLSESLKIAGARNPSQISKFSRSSKTVTPSSTLLKEVLRKEKEGSGEETLMESWGRLAGLV